MEIGTKLCRGALRRRVHGGACTVVRGRKYDDACWYCACMESKLLWCFCCMSLCRRFDAYDLTGAGAMYLERTALYTMMEST